MSEREMGAMVAVCLILWILRRGLDIFVDVRLAGFDRPLQESLAARDQVTFVRTSLE